MSSREKDLTAEVARLIQERDVLARRLADTERRKQATIDRLSLELAQERAAAHGLREGLASAQRRARTWRRVAEWIFNAHQTKE